MKLKIIKRGTHMVELGKINDDVPSPCEVVADILLDFECRLKEMVKTGGTMNLEQQFQSLKMLNNALMEAKEQGWELEVE